MSSQNESEVESLLMSPCWNAGTNGQDYLLDGHKLLLDHDLESLPSDSETQKSSLDMLDNLLSNSNNISSNTNLAELKPLPPFTAYSGHLSINGISGHHYHAIAQRMPEENNNNNYTQNSYQTQCGTNNSSTDHNIVSSSTCLPDSVMNSDGSDSCLSDVKLFSDDGKIYSINSADSCVITSGPDSVSNGNHHNNNNNNNNNNNTSNNNANLNGARIYVDAKELVEYDMSSIEDIAAIIGSAIADTTVPNKMSDPGDTSGDTRDSWMDLDAWIEDTVVPQDSKLIVSHNDALNDFMMPHSPIHSSGSTLQNLLTHGYMPLLQNRLQNGPPIKIEAPTSTSFCNDLISTSTSPPGSVCSTTDNVMLNGNRYMSSNNNNNNSQQNNNNVQTYQILNGLKQDGLCSPELMGNYPHTTSTSSTTKIKRPRNPKKSHLSVSSGGGGNGHQQQMQQQVQNQSSVSVSAHGFQSPTDLSGLLGKEKPVHRCTICNRGFLNKSNIKVHLRTHTGEKPFRCEICAKAFRQKAHLIKHQQIHKRIGRD
jgi:Zinc finger, C2H2 type